MSRSQTDVQPAARVPRAAREESRAPCRAVKEVTAVARGADADPQTVCARERRGVHSVARCGVR